MSMNDVVERWTPLSVREGTREAFGTTVGIPNYLKTILRKWVLSAAEEYQRELSAVIADLELRVGLPDPTWRGLLEELNDEQRGLDLVDWVLGHCAYPHEGYLQEILAMVMHEFDVDLDNKRLVRRCEPTMVTAAVSAAGVEDQASAQLRQAWTLAFGRAEDHMGAWNASVKAVEAMLKPIVSPDDQNATLGKMRAALRQGRKKFDAHLPAESADAAMDQFLACLKVIDYEPGRHGGDERVPVALEARATVFQAVTIVSWLRDGLLERVEK